MTEDKHGGAESTSPQNAGSQQQYRITSNGLLWRVEKLMEYRFLFWKGSEWCLCYTTNDAPAEYTSYDAARATMLKAVDRDAKRHAWMVVEYSANASHEARSKTKGEL